MKFDVRTILTGGLIALLISFFFLFNFSVQEEERDDERLEVVATFSIIYDLAKRVGGERVGVKTLVPIGGEPEEYEPLPEDMRNLAQADIVFSNGLGIERWLERIIQNVGPEKLVVEVTEGITPFYLDEGSFRGEPDPHAWFDPRLVRDYYIPNIVEALSEIDPDGEDYYRDRAKDYKEELNQLHKWIEDEVAQIPSEDRVLITSEGAYRYLVEAYGFEEGFIWQINAHEEGNPRQIAGLVDIIFEKEVKALFTETSVDSRPMERVSEETGVEIKGFLYSDSIGQPGEYGDNYIDMMTYNIETIVGALKGE